MEPTSNIASQVITLHEAGYSPDEIVREMCSRPNSRVTLRMVKGTIERMAGRGADSRMLFAIYEMQVEMLTLLRQIAGERRAANARAAARTLERQGGPKPASVPRSTTT